MNYNYPKDAGSLMIDGIRLEGSSRLGVINPATGAIFATCARADHAQLDAAVAAAKRAFPGWASMGTARRGEHMLKLADALQLRSEEFAALLTQEQGQPLPQSQHQIRSSVAILRGFAAMDLAPRVLKESQRDRVIVHYTPLGVVAAITPWNVPLLLLMQKVGPALITGNTVVAKPAPTTPLTTTLFGALAGSILPPGVFNVIVDDNDLGAPLSRHPDVAKVSFTGSTITGRRVMQSAAEGLKRLTLELGGNDAAIILDDADLSVATPAVFHSAMRNAGQVCFATKRVYAPGRLYDELCERLAALAKATVVGDGFDAGVQMGPLQNAAQFNKVKGYLEDAKRHGSVITGGEPLPRAGYFVPPTIVRDIADSTRLVREEQFGPILPVLKYEDIDDAIGRANDNEFGLGGTVWTGDVARGREIAMRIDTGTVWINKHLDLPLDVPYRGAKQSGIGAENGREGLESYTQPKIINMALV